jgi:hypothetical protein
MDTPFFQQMLFVHHEAGSSQEVESMDRFGKLNQKYAFGKLQ